jgi:hypothetical protein
MNPTIVSGAVSTLSDLGRDEAWLQGWLKEQPSRLGLGELSVDAAPADGPAADGDTFAASKDGRCFSVDVQLGELDANHGFGVLDAWARNRARLPEKDHVAVLVTETCGERYRTTLETLAKHLPLVVVELAVWRGQNEALVIPHVALASEGVDLGAAPASAAASAMSRVSAATTGAAEAPKPAFDAPTPEAKPVEAKPDGAKAAEAKDEAKAEGGSSEPKVEAPANKDDTGVADPWGLPRKEPEAAAAAAGTNGASGSRILSKFNS